MSTNDNSDSQNQSSTLPSIPYQQEDTIGNVVDEMQQVDTSSAEAELNATSMEDNNGGRIEFNEDTDDSNTDQVNES